MKEEFLTTVPFDGFYESYHSDVIDRAVDSVSPAGDSLRDKFMSGIDYGQIFRLYAQEYVRRLREITGLILVFDDLRSPKEYNFTTDRIFAKISRADLAFVIGRTTICDFGAKESLLAKAATEKFSPRDGFISLYSNNYQDWGIIDAWDHNQVGAAVEALIRSDLYESGWTEQSIADSIYESGLLDEFIYQAMGEQARRAIRIHEYLAARKLRTPPMAELSYSSLETLFGEYAERTVNSMAPDELKRRLKQYMIAEHFPAVYEGSATEIVLDDLLDEYGRVDAIKKLQQYGLSEAQADEMLQRHVFGQ
jgi:hypothetical protein